MSSEELFALIALATVGTFTPGPNTALSATIAANHGLRRALPFVCAVPAGWGLLLVLNAAGLGVMVLGYPGRTNRYNTAFELKNGSFEASIDGLAGLSAESVLVQYTILGGRAEQLGIYIFN